jgi:uncharacterized protein
MQIAVISDTHRHSYELNEVLKHIQDTDMIIHLGDNAEDVDILKNGYKGEIINVRGNCDFMSFIPSERLEEVNGMKLLLTHGHRYNVKSDILRLRYRAKQVESNIVLFGHTHEAFELYEDGIWFVNPGSLALPRNGYKSYAILDIDNNNVKVSFRELRELS